MNGTMERITSLAWLSADVPPAPAAAPSAKVLITLICELAKKLRMSQQVTTKQELKYCEKNYHDNIQFKTTVNI